MGRIEAERREWRKGKACSSESSVDKEYTWYKVNSKTVFFLQWLSYMFSLGISEKLE